jgi:hypothetical protein
MLSIEKNLFLRPFAEFLLSEAEGIGAPPRVLIACIPIEHLMGGRLAHRLECLRSPLL